jgi:hypothetical protein
VNHRNNVVTFRRPAGPVVTYSYPLSRSAAMPGTPEHADARTTKANRGLGRHRTDGDPSRDASLKGREALAEIE